MSDWQWMYAEVEAVKIGKKIFVKDRGADNKTAVQLPKQLVPLFKEQQMPSDSKNQQ